MGFDVFIESRTPRNENLKAYYFGRLSSQLPDIFDKLPVRIVFDVLFPVFGFLKSFFFYRNILKC